MLAHWGIGDRFVGAKILGVIRSRIETEVFELRVLAHLLRRAFEPADVVLDLLVGAEPAPADLH